MKHLMRTLCALCALCLAFGATGCRQAANVESGGAAQNYPVVVRDVELTSAPAAVAVLSDAIADVALALGVEAQVVLVSSESTQPAYDELPHLDLAQLTAGTLDAETLAQLPQLDLIVADDSFAPETRAAVEALGAQAVIYMPSPTDRADFSQFYGEIGAIFGGADTGYNAGLAAAAGLCQTLDDLERIIPDHNVLVTAAILYDLDGHGVTGDSFFDSLMTSAGLTNVLSGQTGGTFDLSLLRSQNPSYLFCPEGMAAELVADSRYASLSAVAEGHVTEIDPTLLARLGRSVVTLGTTLAGTAYPELLEAQSTEPTTSVATDVTRELTPGEQSDDVYRMQTRLYLLGYLTVTTYDGYYGSATEDSVRAFQEKNGLEPTGLADLTTLEALFSVDAIPAEE